MKFEWSTVAEAEQGPGPRSRHGLVYDSGARSLVFHGGIDWEQCRCQSDTWEFQQGVWRRIETTVSPPARHRGAMVFDSRRGCTVLFGGQLDSGRIQSDTWLYADGKWTEQKSSFWNRPSARCGHMMAFDESSGLTVLFGGIGGAFYNSQVSLCDTWSFDGSRWRFVTTQGPARRRYAAFAYHPQLGGCVLHGGAYDDLGKVTYGDTWLFRDGEWKQLPQTFAGYARDDHGIGYHVAAESLVLLEGLSRPRECFTLGRQQWDPADIQPMHPRLQCSPLAYVPELDGLVMHGGEVSHGGDQFDQTWVLRRCAADGDNL